MEIELIKTGLLIPYARNSRTHDDAQVSQIAASIKEFGFTNPVLIDADNGIIAGHGRVLAAQKLSLEFVPCIRLAHLSENQKRAYIIADNKLALNAGWDDEMLRLELAELEEDGFDLDLTGFSLDEISDLQIEEIEEGLTDEDAAPELAPEPVTKLGDVWLLGKHRVMCGDSTSIDDMARLTNGVLVDMLLTDPPYNVAYEGKTKDFLTIKNDQMGDIDFRQFLRDAYTAADSVMKPGAVFYIWHADLEGYNFRGAANDAGWEVRQCLIWKKQSFVLGRQDYHWQHEPCLYGWKEGAGHLWAADRKQTTILEFDRPSRNGDHPTMKPVALFEYQMLNNTKGGDIVLDSFGGSGTTIIVAEKNGRVGYAMELDPKYCDVIVKRWQEFTGKQAALESDGRTFDEVMSCGIQ
ncbi:site-specific DNA-methyltransferase [Halothiobacillus sp.]|uniref:site-specific DNA-methyltransferase n=1 Tax=Halothiobacillus sp. TaxID=1891311 RepID=UPI00260F9828|nr:site-specific DNA-methyltransferase [Halothiobacillus sp.]